MDLNGKNVILTGASSGIGLELLNQLLKFDNLRIVAVARNINTIPTRNGVVFPFSADLSTEEGVDATFSFANTIFDRVDLFIANAGYAYLEKLDNPDWLHIKKIYELNVFSPIYSLEKFAKQNSGIPKYFVCTSSAVAFVPLPYYSLYSSTKAGVHQFMEAYRYEKNKELKVMTVYPVATKTTFFDKASAEKNPPLPFLVQSPDAVAHSIIRGLMKNRKKVYPSLLFRIFNKIGFIFPVILKLYSHNEKRKLEKYLPK